LSSQIPAINETAIRDFLCAVLRGDLVDWPDSSATDFYDALMAQANYHGVDALLFHILRPTKAWETLPAPFTETLYSQLKLAVAFELVRSRDLIDLVHALNCASIPFVILKGCAIANSHYPAPYLRSRCDTDLFIDMRNIRATRTLLSELGYELGGHIYKSHQFNAYRTTFGGSINYDIHWRINNHAKYARVLGFKQAKQEAVPVPGVDGAFSLKPVHALLLACVHMAGNSNPDLERLIWLYDIHLLVSAMTEHELLEFAQQAVGVDAQAECREGIGMTHACFSTYLPESAQKVLCTPSAADSIGKRFANSALGLIVDDMWQLPDVRSQFELVCEYLFPPADYLLDRYHKKGRFWVPWLYIRYVTVGFFQRISLR